jgi:hypothetical protein
MKRVAHVTVITTTNAIAPVMIHVTFPRGFPCPFSTCVMFSARDPMYVNNAHSGIIPAAHPPPLASDRETAPELSTSLKFNPCQTAAGLGISFLKPV